MISGLRRSDVVFLTSLLEYCIVTKAMMIHNALTECLLPEQFIIVVSLPKVYQLERNSQENGALESSSRHFYFSGGCYCGTVL